MVVIQLQGLRANNPQVQAATPAIDVDMLQGSPATTCQAILPSARMSGSATTYLDSLRLNSQLQSNLSNFSSQLKSLTIDQAQEASTNPSYTRINSYLTNLETVQIPSYRLVRNCLQEANQIKVTDYDEQKARTEESKLRLDSMLHPEESVSYYEGWFPLFRPMKEQTLFALFGTALFLLLLSIWILLKFNGFEFNIMLPGSVQVGSVSQYKGYLIGGAVVGLVVGVIGSMRGWFS